MFIQMEGDLFQAVQEQKIFPDSKTFVDALPKISPDKILKEYHANPNVDLKKFVHDHFELPAERESPRPHAHSIEEYIEKMWVNLCHKMSEGPHSTLIPLPHPHIVPGGRFRGMYYWDSYFVAVGLAASHLIPLLKTQIENFAYLIDQYGYIPNGNRQYYRTRSQAPYFSFLLALLLEYDEAALKFFPQLEKEYTFWMKDDRFVPELHLNRYWDELNTPRPESYDIDLNLGTDHYRDIRAACESGWDFSSRWLEIPNQLETIRTTDILPVDLNCLLHHHESTLALFAKHLSKKDLHEKYHKLAAKRKEAILHTFWNEEQGFFFDHCISEKKQTEVWSLAGVMPLFVGIATPSQAEKVASHLEKSFLKAGGLLTTLTESGQQWDAPNGWAPLQWIAFCGLMHYGQKPLAKTIAKRWTTLNEHLFSQAGTLFEKYNVETEAKEATAGEYVMQDGFGWTNGVYLALKGVIA